VQKIKDISKKAKQDKLNMVKLSVVIITLNEEKNIERCLESVKGIADDIVVVDSGSTDNTVEICRRFKARVIQHPFEGHIQQKNWAISQANYPQIISLDADEALSEQLRDSILSVKKNWKKDGYKFNRLTNYCGKWIRHGSWYPSKKLRLWDSRKGKWKGNNPHDKFIMEKGSRTKHLKGDLLHYSYYSIEAHIEQINYFSDILADTMYQSRKRVNFFIILAHPLWRFFRDFFIKFGFLDGFTGLIITVNSSHETFLKYIKLRNLYRDYKLHGKNRVCFFNSTRSWGGGEKWHYDVSTRLSEKGINPIVVTNKNSELKTRISDYGIPSYNIGISNLSFLNLFKVFHISRIIKREKVDFIITNLSSDMKVASFAAKIAGVPNIVYRRGSAIPVRNSFINRFFFGKVLTGIIANSEETKRTLLARNPNLFDKDKIQVIYNGISIKKYDSGEVTFKYASDNDEIILGNAGRLVKQKGQYRLIQLARILKDKGYKFKILIAGDGALQNDLIAYSRKMGMENEVVFLGFVDDIKGFMQSLDIFLLPSLWEGFGYVMTEAMVCRKPVIAFDLSSNPEIVVHEETGYLAEKNNMSSFAHYVEKLIHNPVLSRQMGEKGRIRVEEKFNIDKTISAMEDFLQR
jgi:glycosyltransferase involved in cell wall biosynthesis